MSKLWISNAYELALYYQARPGHEHVFKNENVEGFKTSKKHVMAKGTSEKEFND